MIVTQTEPLTKTKWKVYLDGKFAFVLYKGELSRFHITQGEELSEEIFVKIRDCLLYTSPSPRDGLLSRMPSSA